MKRRDFIRLAPAMFAASALSCKRDDAFSCLDESALTADEVTARHVVVYTDVSPERGKDCSNCSQYLKPSGAACGGCKLIKGPVHPRGYCKVYAPNA